MISNVLLLPAASLILGSMFLLSAVPKLTHPNRFLLAAAAYDLIPGALLGAVARLVPTLELSVALLLLSGASRRLGALLAGLLLLCFLAGILVNMFRGHAVDCGCFGRHSPRIGPLTVALDLSMFSASAYVALVEPRWMSSDTLSITVLIPNPYSLAVILVASACATSLLPRVAEQQFVTPTVRHAHQG